MTYVADLHLHSYYARGTSKHLNFENLAAWAGTKGIDLLATADFTHPDWFLETRRKLEETGDGLYRYRGARFILGTELNCVGEQGGRNRRVHMLAFAPSLDIVDRINTALAARGNLRGDGRPTLHLTPRELVSALLEIDERCLVIPAHVWAPWFGVYGSKSGFDSLEECFGDTADQIYAIETGLSSEPAMNWRVSELDGRSIVSFSDAHSLPKLGRELTVLEGELSYDGLAESLRTQRIAYTVEFFPEEGKYHYSGHRKCGVSLSPGEMEGHDGRCPVCRRPLTVGVLHRVYELASLQVATWRDEAGLTRGHNGRPPFKMMVALQEIIAETLGFGVNAKRVQARYRQLIDRFGSEFFVLMEASVDEIGRASTERIAEGIARVRSGEISITPGYDGLFGKVSVWPEVAGRKPLTP